jgi:hypothetical protein
VGDRQLVGRRPDVHALIVENEVLDMDKLAPDPHAGRRIEEVAALDEALADRTAADLLVQPGELVLRPPDRRQQGSGEADFRLCMPLFRVALFVKRKLSHISLPQETFTNDRLSLSSVFGKPYPLCLETMIRTLRRSKWPLTLQNRASRRPQGRLIGYARVSTDEQATEAQEIELRAAGCDVIVQEHGSGASRARPALSKLMREIGAGDVLVVVRLDRLARSVSHLLEVIEDLTARARIFARCAIRSTRRRRRACSRCRCSAPLRSSSAR